MENKYYKAGWDEWNKQLKEGKQPYVCHDLFPDGPSNVVGGSPEWMAFLEGARDAEKAYIETLQVKEFLAELSELTKKYNINLSCGCGCCGGATIKDLLNRTFDITDRI